MFVKCPSGTPYDKKDAFVLKVVQLYSNKSTDTENLDKNGHRKKEVNTVLPLKSINKSST